MSIIRIAARRFLPLVLLPLLLPTAAPAALREQDVLKVDQAFRYQVEATGPREVTVRWQIAPGYYLYRERMSYASGTEDVTLGTVELPTGEPHEDDYFGPMQIYRDHAEVRIPLAGRPAGATPFELTIRSQGCADAGLCYPPQKWSGRVDLPAEGPAEGRLGKLLDRLAPGTKGDPPLPVGEAFRHSVVLSGPDTLRVSWKIAPGYYLYQQSLKVTAAGDAAALGTPKLPAAQPKVDEEYGETLVYYDEVTLDLPITRRSPEAVRLPLSVAFQGCREGSLCYPPQAVAAAIDLPKAGVGASGAAAGPVSEQDSLSALIGSGNILVVMGVFAATGLLLAFTPCCLPMIPILSGIIVGQGANISDLRAFLLALTYVLGMAITYTITGAVFAAAGAQVQAVFQQTWVIVGVAGLFVALALSMFGLFELQMPSFVQTRLTQLSGRQRGGSFIGAGIMGMISAVVVTTCVTPPLIAALTVIARSGDVLRGALALFALAIGMGLPLLAIGASAGRLMPKAGPWMDTVRSVFGLLMLGMAAWMLDRLWPGAVTLAIWGVLLLVGGVFVGAFGPLEPGATLARKAGKGLGLAVTVYGIALLVGALAGNEDPLRPLRFAAAGAPSAERTSALTRIKSVADLDRELARARAESRPVMLDFYADWCASCKEMEKLTFPDPAVQSAFAGAIVLQADVTAVDAEDQALMARFGIVGPPTIVFFGPDGTERTADRVVGFEPADTFAAHLRRVFGQDASTAVAGTG